MQEVPLGLWHCFGHREEIVDWQTACRMLDASGTGLLPINTNKGRALIGHGDVRWPNFQHEADKRGLTVCLNINLQTTAADAVAQAVRFRDETGISLVKLEVLNDDLATSNDAACAEASGVLAAAGFDVMPLFSDRLPENHRLWPDDWSRVPVLRLMGSPIGSGLGIKHPSRIAAACQSFARPVVLDGGIGSPDDARTALGLGCAGFLVNSCLFKHPDPAAALQQYRSVIDERRLAAA